MKGENAEEIRESAPTLGIVFPIRILVTKKLHFKWTLVNYEESECR